VGSTQMTIRRMRNNSWVPQPTNSHLEFVIFCVFPL